MVAYLPGNQSIRIATDGLAGPLAGTWVSPVTGERQDAGVAQLGGVATFNRPGDGDWLELAWDKPQRVSQLQLTLDSGFQRELTLSASDAATDGTVRAAQPDRALASAQMEKLLQEAIASLDEDQREVIILRDVEDLSIEEICEIAKLPDGTVKSRLHRARLVLRKKMQRHVE